MQIGGGNDDVAMKHLPLMLEGSARAWLNQLAPGSIYSWEELARVFVRTFEGTCKRPAGLTETGHTERAMIEIIRLEAGCMFQAPSVSAEPSEQH